MSETTIPTEDLRFEAGLCLDSIVTLPTPEEIVRHLRAAYVPSRDCDDERPTWGDLFTEEQLADAARQIAGVMTAAAPVGRWAVDLGADGLEPSPHVLNLDGDDKPVVRIHMAFDPDLPERARQQFGLGLAQVMADAL